jgi:hypothetical protein
MSPQQYATAAIPTVCICMCGVMPVQPARPVSPLTPHNTLPPPSPPQVPALGSRQRDAAGNLGPYTWLSYSQVCAACVRRGGGRGAGRQTAAARVAAVAVGIVAVTAPWASPVPATAALAVAGVADKQSRRLVGMAAAAAVCPWLCMRTAGCSNRASFSSCCTR